MAMIGASVQAKIEMAIRDLLFTRLEDIDRAYMESEKGLKLTIPISIKPGDKGLWIKVGLRGITGKIDDSLEIETSENQGVLFTQDGKEGV